MDTDTKAQGGREDGSMAADHELSAAVSMVGETSENPAGSVWPPTLTIRPGFPVRVMVTRDLVLEPYRS
jgi:type IV secretory pathway VirB10-like protein